MIKRLLPLMASLTAGAALAAPVSYPLFFEPSPTTGQYLARGKGYQSLVHSRGLDLQSGDRKIPIRWSHSRSTQVRPLDQQQGVTNYFHGRDPEQWRTNIPHFSRMQWPSVFPGIDVVLYGNGTSLEFDVILAPGANAADFEMDFGENSDIQLTPEGELRLSRELKLKKPFAYQQIAGVACPVPVRFERRSANHYGFAVGSYDKSKPLIIDPVLTYSSYFGGSLADQINAVAADNAGNVYIAGSTTSVDLPGAVRGAGLGSQDVFVAKLNPTGTAVIYATYIGGTGQESASAMTLDSTGSVYLTGQVGSTNFPTTQNAAQPQLAGGSGITDAFALRLNAAGSALLYSTFLGGPLSDTGNAIALDAQGNAFIAGGTQSLTFPAVTNADFPIRGGGDAFVTKINPDGSKFLYTLIMAGFGLDTAYGVAVDTRGSVYVTGETRSSNFPVTEFAYQKQLKGTSDAFITKFSSTGDVEYSTYFGGDSADLARAIAVDSQGNAHITGQTYSANFPVTNGAIQQAASLIPDAFASKLSASGTGLVYSTYIGASADDIGNAIVLDPQNNAYIAGESSSVDFPLKADASGPSFPNSGGNDAFVTKLNVNGTAFVFSTQLGGSGNDGARAIAVNAGRIYIAGTTSSNNFRQTPGVVGLIASGESDGFVARFSELTVGLQPTEVTVGPGDKVQFTATVLNANNPAVRWAVFPALGTIDANGLYQAPAIISQQQPIVVTLTSVADASKFAEASITLSPIGSIIINPNAVNLVARQTQQFTATQANVVGRPPLNWSISPNLGTISPTGFYTAPDAIDALTTVTVKATLPSDATRSGSAVVTLVPNFPQVTAAGLVNAASYAPLGSGVSPGLIITLFGIGLGPQTPATAKLNSQGRIDTNLETTRVLFDGVPAPMIATSSGQISAIVPYSVGNQVSTQMQVEFQGRKSVVVPFPVVPTSPGLFTANASGKGQAAALNQDGTYNSALNPATRGSIVVLFATGEGKTTPDGVDGKLTAAPLPSPQAPVAVTIGGVDAEIIYAGGAPGLTAGLLQINIRVPLGSVPSATAPIAIRIGNTTSPIGVTIATR